MHRGKVLAGRGKIIIIKQKKKQGKFLDRNEKSGEIFGHV